MLRCPVADAIMWEPELDGVVIATSDKHNASRVHFVVLTWHKLSEDTPKIKRAPPPKPCLNSDLRNQLYDDLYLHTDTPILELSSFADSVL